MGTPDFAVPSLKAIIDEGYNVVGVIIAPDKEAGRGRRMRMPAIKKYALESNLNILQPQKLKDEGFLNELRSLRPNLQIVVAFRMLPEVVWSLPELGTFNLHASLLPQYRGAAPINFVLINGEKITGLTTFFLDNKIDTGKIILQEKIKIKEDIDAGTLHNEMMVVGSKLVLKTVEFILHNKVTTKNQAKFIKKNQVLKTAPKLNKEDCRIVWNNYPNSIFNFVRGLSPYPASFGILASKSGVQHPVKIFKVAIESTSEPDKKIGSVLTDEKTYLKVIVKSGIISILELQLAGKRRMNVSDFLRGFQKIDEYYFE